MTQPDANAYGAPLGRGSRLAMAIVAVIALVGIAVSATIASVAALPRHEPVRLPAPDHAETAVLQYLVNPVGVAVDKDGNVYAADGGSGWVLELPVGATAPVKLPFPDNVSKVNAIAVDKIGSVYVAGTSSGGAGRVWKLTAGTPTIDALPFTALKKPNSLAVDADGNVFVADGDDYGSGSALWKLTSGANVAHQLVFDSGDVQAFSLAVDGAGNLYFSTRYSRHFNYYYSREVYKVAAGSTHTELLFQGGSAVAVDNSGNVYAATRSAVLKLAAGASEPTMYANVSRGSITDIAVDSNDNVYVAVSSSSPYHGSSDGKDGEVLKLEP